MSVAIPARTWALIWVIIVGSIGTFLWLVFSGAMGNVEQRFYRLQAPGSMELPHLARGHYFVYHEFDKSRDSKEDLHPAGFERLQITLTPLDGGDQLKLKAVEKMSRFVIRRSVCESKFEFDVAKAGGYRVNAEYTEGFSGGTYRIAIGKPYYMQALQNFLIGLSILIVAGVTVTVLLFRSGGMGGAPLSEETHAG